MPPASRRPTHGRADDDPELDLEDEIVWDESGQLTAHSWRASENFVPRRVVRPLQHIIAVEASSALVVLGATILALIIANTDLVTIYHDVLATPVRLDLGSHRILDLTIHGIINDGLMVIFFLLVSLEIKREMVFGELADPRAALLPITAAVGGMVVPALIYAAFNAGGPYGHGWGIPMATDIAFAVAVVAALGSRVPSGARLFLLTLAIVDDLGAIIVIAVFYAEGLDVMWLGVAAAAVVIALIARARRVRAMPWYLALGVLCWYALLRSGVHATIAGVVFGLITPAYAFLAPQRFPGAARRLINGLVRRNRDGVTIEEQELNDHSLRELRRLSRETQSPLHRIEIRLSPVVAFGVIPVFAFANAGITIPFDQVAALVSDPVVLGIVLGLVLGKTVGVFGSAYLFARLGWARLPRGVTYRHLFGIALCAGIGFTVAIFIAGLAFVDGEVIETAKLAIIVASVIAAVLGYLWLRRGSPREARAH